MTLARALVALSLLAGYCTTAAANLEIAVCDAASAIEVLHAQASPEATTARAVWLDRAVLYWPGDEVAERYRLHYSARGALVPRIGERLRGADGVIDLQVVHRLRSVEALAELAYLGGGVELAVTGADRDLLDRWYGGQILVTREDARGRVTAFTATQIALALDRRYAAAAQANDLGAHPARDRARFAVWAPTAREVAVCLHRDPKGQATELLPMTRDDKTGMWRGTREGDLRGQAYTFALEVFARGTGVVRQRVTDPYALSLDADSRHGILVDLDDPALKPEHWDDTPAPRTVRGNVDMVIYELHVRDFSIGDGTVPETMRGKYLAFTQGESDGMRHLRALARAGITDVHLLPVFDLASVPERDCVTPRVSGGPAGETQQAAIRAVAARDCFNWGYDPLHYTAPEGSYASDADDGATRVREFRAMVRALHAAGLRVGMDVVYNHTHAAGQTPLAVLDRLVPDYYQRLDTEGVVATSTCCANTATEHRMMAKLMIDSAVVWARDYRIDSFRFDLMGHQPRTVMEALQVAVNRATGREVQLLGEGWNFGEIADGRRFVQASQLSLNGSGIGTFNDRLRDAVRGGGPADDVERQISQQGLINGLSYAPNARAPAADREALMRAADQARAGLAGSLRDYVLTTFDGRSQRLDALDYHGQPTGYVSAPGEVVNYVENHDNQTLFDINVFKLPVDTDREERARVQLLGAAFVTFAQGTAYFHAGIELLRSKSMDRNSFDSGDWFNRLDWTGRDNGFGAGLPPSPDNAKSWELMRPLLADARLRPRPRDIAWMRATFEDLLRIRASTRLFRLDSADAIRARLRFENVGPKQEPTVIAAHLDGAGLEGARFAELMYFINVDRRAHTIAVPSARDKAYRLHPVQRAAEAADRRARRARFVADRGEFVVPPRSAVVFVID